VQAEASDYAGLCLWTSLPKRCFVQVDEAVLDGNI
jgi:hypothetical protein